MHWSNLLVGLIAFAAFAYGFMTFNVALMAVALATPMIVLAMSFAGVKWQVRLALALLAFSLILLI